MKKLILFLFLIQSAFIYAGKELKYPVSEISAELKKNAKAVIRENNVSFTIFSKSNASMEVTRVITIMNKTGNDYSILAMAYNKFFKVKNIKATYYDQYGKVIKTLKRDELINIPAISGYSLYEDHRAILYNPEIATYPFTAEIKYTLDFNGLFSYPEFEVFDDYNISVENTKYEINIPNDLDVKQYVQNMNEKPQIIHNDKSTSYQWNIKNKTALEYEPYSPPIYNFEPRVCFSPSEFEIGGVPGNLRTWSEYGQWIYNLNQDKNILPLEAQQKIKELVKDAKTDFEKVSILYKYLQDKTRYVNVTVGLGGWQSIEAEKVDRLSYGDCKALSNYMKSLLDVVGIKSNYVLVNAGSYKENIIKDFPMNQFNHVIVCVPMNNDTLWLECTSQRYPVGYIGDFTDNRDVLIIKDKDSHIAHSKVYKKEENSEKRQIRFELNNQGEGIAEIKTTYHGLKTEDVFDLIHADPEDVKRYQYHNLNLSNFTLIDFNYSYKDSIIPDIYENLNLNIKSYASVMGNRLIVPANMINKIERLPKKVSNRNTNVFIRRPKLEVDSIDFIIPNDYMVESLPKPIEIQSKYGSYNITLSENDGVVHCVRTYSLNNGEYAPSEYDSFRNFLEEISKADNTKFTIIKK